MYRMTLKMIGSLALVLLLSSPAWSAGGVYVTLFGGGTWIEDIEENAITDIYFDSGYHAGIAIGKTVGSFEGTDVRLEVEAAYRSNDVDRMKDRIAPGVDLPLGGEATSYSLMVNGYIDFVNSTVVTPYVGAGIGYAEVDYDLSIFGVTGLKDSDGVYAYQLMAGVNCELTERFSLDLEYRWFVTDHPDVRDNANVKGDFEYDTHNAKLGLRYTF